MKPTCYLLALFWLAPPALAQDQPSDTTDAIYERIRSLEHRILRLESQLEVAEAENEALRQELDIVSGDHATQTEALYEANLRIADLERENAAIRGETEMVPPPDAQEDQRDMEQEIIDLQRRNDELEELAGLVPQSERVTVQEARVESSYDAGSDTTTVVTVSDQVRPSQGSRADHWTWVGYTFPGQSLTEPVPVTWTLKSMRSGATYRGQDTLELTVDGDPMSLPIDNYERRFRRERGTDRSDETLEFVLDPDTLRRLSNAVTVDCRIGVVRFTLTPDQIAMFRAMRARMDRGM